MAPRCTTILGSRRGGHRELHVRTYVIVSFPPVRAVAVSRFFRANVTAGTEPPLAGCFLGWCSIPKIPYNGLGATPADTSCPA